MASSNTFKKLIVGTLSVSLTGKLLQVAVGIALARLLQPEGYGVYALSIAFSFVVVRVVNLGWPITVNRLLPRYQAEDDLSSFKGVIVSAIVTILATCSIAGLVVAASWGLADQSLATKTIVMSVCAIVPMLAFRTLLKNLLAALQAPKRGLALEDLIPATAVLIWIGVLHTYQESITPLSAAIAYALASLLSIAIGILWLISLLPKNLRQTTASFDLKPWLQSSATTMWGQAARLLVNRADIIMLGALSTLEATGLYAVALRICQLLTIPSMTIQTFIAPNVSDAEAKGDGERSRSLFRLSLLFAVASALPLAAAFSYWREPLITVAFGNDFLPAASVILVLALGKVFVAISNALSSYMMMTDRERLFSALSTASMVVNLIANFILIPLHGAVGAALATLLSVTLLCAAQLWCCRSVITEIRRNSN